MKRLADDSKQAEFLLSNVGFFGGFFFFSLVLCVCACPCNFKFYFTVVHRYGN